MRKITVSLLFGILLCGNAGAAEPSRAALQEYAGRYELADGRLLTVSEDKGVLTASIGPRAGTMRTRFSSPREFVLTPDGTGGFRASAAPLRLRFSQDGAGDVASVQLDEHAAPMVALARR